jgi:L-arabinose isomerase
MTNLKKYEIWFVTGSQDLYGNETLQKVASHARIIVQSLDNAPQIPVIVTFKEVVKNPDEIYKICQAANTDANCVGIVAWMHTFSPARMWIRGLKALQKPLLHLHTQFNRDIPWDNIDMDFMNLNQSAHGDREFGFMMTRMRLNRKVVVGHWQDPTVLERLNVWIRAAVARFDWQGAKFCRFGDNMRQVAVTEGDKVEAELQFGYSVNGHGIGDLAAYIQQISDTAITKLVQEYHEKYHIRTFLQQKGTQNHALREAAKIELGLRAFLQAGDFKGFTTTFEDLHGLVQLPGIAVQRLMADGYGFGAEGDWKTAAMVRAMKVMASGMSGGNSFMEDYTYHFEPHNNLVLGAHMLEICESIAQNKPSCEIHPLGIGGKSDPVRLVFNTAGGSALNVSMVDMGNRFRLLVNEVEAVTAEHNLPKLPVARVLWKPKPDMLTGCAAWIYAGGAHHTVYSQNLTTEYIADFAEMFDTELVVIDANTELRQFKKELKWNEMAYK